MVNLINIIQSEERYRDRFKFFLSLDDKVDRQVIYVQHFSSDVSGYKNTTIKTPPTQCVSGIKFWLWVFKDIFRYLKKRKERWIVVEHLTGLVLFFLRLLRPFMGVELLLVHGIYSEDVYYLKNKVWRKDAPELLNKAQDKLYRSRWKKRVIRNKFYFKVCDVAITNSLRMLDWLPKHYSKPTFHVPNTVNMVIEEEDLTSKKDIDILYVGGITPAKGIVHFLESVESMHKNMKVVLIGGIKKWDMQWSEKFFRRFSGLNMEYIPHLPWDELQDYYRMGKIFILPSYSEGSARVLLEALNFGCTVIASDIPGNHFYKNETQNPIYYYEQGNEMALKKQILSHLQINNENRKKTKTFFKELNSHETKDALIEFYLKHQKKVKQTYFL